MADEDPIPAEVMDVPWDAPEAPFDDVLDEALSLWSEGFGVSMADAATGLAVFDPDNDDEGMPLAADDACGIVGRWKIDNDEAAEWAGRKYAEAEHARQVILDRHARWIGQIQKAGEAQARRHVARALFFGEHLMGYAIRRREAGGAATLPLSAATVRTQAAKAAVTVPKGADGADARLALVAWAIEHGVKGVVNPGVYLRELAKVAHPMQRVTLALDECGHVVAVDVHPDLTITPPDTFGCEECRAALQEAREDAPRAEAPRRTVGGVAVRLVVVDGAGEEVPGAVVDPAHITASVTPS